MLYTVCYRAPFLLLWLILVEEADTTKFLKIGTLKIINLLVLKIGTAYFFSVERHPKDAVEMTNSVDPDQTAP